MQTALLRHTCWAILLFPPPTQREISCLADFSSHSRAVWRPIRNSTAIVFWLIAEGQFSVIRCNFQFLIKKQLKTFRKWLNGLTISMLTEISWSSLFGCSPDCMCASNDGSASRKCGNEATIGAPMQSKRSSVPGIGQAPSSRQKASLFEIRSKLPRKWRKGTPRLYNWWSYCKFNEMQSCLSYAQIGSWILRNGAKK